ncbi:MAG: hypothetical protein EBU52_06370 [Cytophagia bacterium]|nr:hypothetical protein [Cytophagia bacterium]
MFSKYLRTYIVLIAIFYAAPLVVFPQSNSMIVTESVNGPENSTKSTCHIEGKKIGQRAFKKFLAELEQIESTWMCIKRKEGGITRYQAKDKTGTIYQYEVEQFITESGKERTKQSLVRLKPNASTINQ